MFHKHKEKIMKSLWGIRGERDRAYRNAGWRGERVFGEKSEKETWESTKAQLVIYTGEFLRMGWRYCRHTITDCLRSKLNILRRRTNGKNVSKLAGKCYMRILILHQGSKFAQDSAERLKKISCRCFRLKP